MDCPNCHDSDSNHAIWGPRNVAAAVGNVRWYDFQICSIFLVTHEGWALKRKRLKCGYLFLGLKPFTPNFDECAKCGYNLPGNVSGRCSECGWKLLRRYRAYRRRIATLAAREGGTRGRLDS